VQLSLPVRLGLLFGALYFLQGLVEPGDGLIAQPTRARLERWGWDAAQVAGASLLTALPWSLKPLYGLLSDAVPLFGARRRGWLALVSGAAALALAIVALAPADSGLVLVAGLAVATMAIAFADVVVDAHMVEVAQPRGLTGTLQSVQWAAIYTAAALAGALGGRLSAAGAERTALAIAAGGSLTMLLLALVAVRDVSPGTGPFAHVRTDRPGPASARLRAALAERAVACRDPGLRCAAGFLALWSFSPGYGAVYDFHLTRGLGLPETLYGDAAAVHAIACAIASALYGLYCRRVAMATLLHLAIALGVASALACALARDPTSLMWTSAVGGAAYMSATLVQLDLAARLCPPRLAGSVFALLMAVQNLSLSVAGWLGGHGYELLRPGFGPVLAYAALAAAGAACTAGCWLLLPALRRRAAPALTTA
jgi:MFS family permease